MNKISTFIKQNSEEQYREFNKKLITTDYEICGVRLPKLREFSKTISIDELTPSNDSTYEEIMLYSFCAAKLKLEAEQLSALETILPFIDNWSTCDCTISALKRLNGEKSYNFFTKLLTSEKTYYKRVGIVGLMRNFIKSEHIEEICENLKKIPLENADYYVKIALAWFYAELCISNFDLAKDQIASTSDKFVRNKSISKARESFRVTNEQKAILSACRL